MAGACPKPGLSTQKPRPPAQIHHPPPRRRWLRALPPPLSRPGTSSPNWPKLARLVCGQRAIAATYLRHPSPWYAHFLIPCAQSSSFIELAINIEVYFGYRMYSGDLLYRARDLHTISPKGCIQKRRCHPRQPRNPPILLLLGSLKRNSKGPPRLPVRHGRLRPPYRQTFHLHMCEADFRLIGNIELANYLGR